MSTESQNDQPQQPAEGAAESQEVHVAAEAVRLAKIQLEKAQKYYDELCRQAAEKIQSVRETTIGEVIDKTLETTKKHPGPSLLISAAAGFCLGRWFQRLFRKG
ncbi:MAG TPA: hypothetical protein VIH42_00730 [Thermoguttaceae bacterium]